jgi:hypothetical protein
MVSRVWGRPEDEQALKPMEDAMHENYGVSRRTAWWARLAPVVFAATLLTGMLSPSPSWATFIVGVKVTVTSVVGNNVNFDVTATTYATTDSISRSSVRLANHAAASCSRHGLTFLGGAGTTFSGYAGDNATLPFVSTTTGGLGRFRKSFSHAFALAQPWRIIANTQTGATSNTPLTGSLLTCKTEGSNFILSNEADILSQTPTRTEAPAMSSRMIGVLAGMLALIGLGLLRLRRGL